MKDAVVDEQQPKKKAKVSVFTIRVYINYQSLANVCYASVILAACYPVINKHFHFSQTIFSYCMSESEVLV